DNAVLPTGPGTHYPMNDTPYRSWMCVVCGFIYDEAAGLPDDGIPPGTRWEDIPETWTCPDRGVANGGVAMAAVPRRPSAPPTSPPDCRTPAPPPARAGKTFPRPGRARTAA